MRRLTSGAVLALTLLACAPSPAGGTPDRPATLRLENQSWSLVAVYQTCDGGTPQRIGEVEAVSRGRFRLRECPTGSASFAVRPLAGRAYGTELIQYRAGDVVTLDVRETLPPVLSLLPRREP